MQRGHENLLSRFFSELDLNKLLSFPQLNENQRRHLFDVYSLMLGGILTTGAAAGGGIWAVSNDYISSGFLSFVGLIGSLASIFLIQMDNATDIGRNESKEATTRQIVSFGGLSVSTGLTLVGVLIHAMILNAQILVTAIMATAAIFASLSLSALFARRRSLFWLGSIAATLTTYLLLASLASLFMPSRTMFNVVTYLGLGTAAIYTLVDTQVIAESARLGNRNTVNHALQVYLDCINLFVRLISILMDKEQNKRRRDKRV